MTFNPLRKFFILSSMQKSFSSNYYMWYIQVYSSEFKSWFLGKPAPHIWSSEAARKQPNLNKLGDGRGFKDADAGFSKNQLLSLLEYIPVPPQTYLKHTDLKRQIFNKSLGSILIQYWPQTFVENLTALNSVFLGKFEVERVYTSQTCSCCQALGIRVKHRFSCPNCGSLQHSDLNASRNLLRLGQSIDGPTGDVSRRHVAAFGRQ